MFPTQSTQLPRATRIREVIPENERTKTFVFDQTWTAEPGQFLMAWLPRFDEKPFSLVAADPVTITVAAVGPFTGLLHGLESGDRVWLRGPFGHGFKVLAGPVLAVGGGYGVAPISFLTRRVKSGGGEITAVVGARGRSDLLFAERLAKEGADVRVTTEDGSVGRQGLVTTEVEPLLASGHYASLVACGPHGMLTALESLAHRYQIPAQLSWEAYMRCGIGLCGSCEHEGKVLCLDGPVLSVLLGKTH